MNPRIALNKYDELEVLKIVCLNIRFIYFQQLIGIHPAKVCICLICDEIPSIPIEFFCYTGYFSFLQMSRDLGHRFVVEDNTIEESVTVFGLTTK